MATENRFALLDTQEEVGTAPKKNKKPTGAKLQTPAERAQNKTKQNKPPQQNKPQVVNDDTGFVSVQTQNKREGPKKLNKDEFLKEKSLGNNPIQNIPENTTPPPRGEYQSRGGNKNRGGKARNPRRPNDGVVEDVNARSLNKPDFIPGGTRKYSLDKPGKNAYNPNRNYKGGKGGNKGGNRGGNQGGNQGKRQFDRHSATGLDNAPKKQEAGAENWGDAVKEQVAVNVENTQKPEESSSSEEYYYPEPDEKGEEKKDDIVRKGYSAHVRKLQEERANVQVLLEKHGVKKEKVEIKANVPENVSNINKKEKTALELESERDALYIKNQQAQGQTNTGANTENQQSQTQANTGAKKKVFIASSELKFRGKRHRGINVPLEELPQRQPRAPKSNFNNNNNNQNNQDKKDNTNAQTTEQTQSDQNATNENAKFDSPNRGSGNFRGKRGGNRGGKGGKRIFADDFPSLSNAVITDEKPQWVQESN